MSTSSVLLSARERLLADLAEELQALEQQHLRRRLVSIDAVNGPLVSIDGRELVCWCSNDYLGLASHPALAAAATRVTAEWGLGARASRLLAGTTSWHSRLEDALAAWFGQEAAIVYPSGYLANLGTLGALLSSSDAVFVDRLAHASLIDAARASRATFRVFHHNDPAHLADILARAGRALRRLIVTEGIFSMDGDPAPLSELVEIAEAHGALVYLDDAHGAFVLGETGGGLPQACGLPHDRLLYMGTLGKALGCQGGFVVGPRTLIDFLHNRARTFIYTTALAVPIVAAALEALRLIRAEPMRRVTLQERVRQLGQRLRSLGLLGPREPAHIIPLIIGPTSKACQVAQQLWERGIWAPAIRPPTVPEGTARLRLSVTALHTESQSEALAQALQGILAI